jgi:hypothetical protein
VIITRSPAKPMAASAARWLLTAGGVACLVLVIAYHRHVWQAIAASVPPLVALAWSQIQKVVDYHKLWDAYLATPPSTPPNHPLAVKAAQPKETTVDLKTLLADTLAAVQAALPADYQAGIAKALDEGLTVAQNVADSEIAGALNKLPPALSPFAPEISALADNAIAAAQANAQAAIDKWAAVKAAVAQ